MPSSLVNLITLLAGQFGSSKVKESLEHKKYLKAQQTYDEAAKALGVAVPHWERFFDLASAYARRQAHRLLMAAHENATLPYEAWATDPRGAGIDDVLKLAAPQAWADYESAWRESGEHLEILRDDAPHEVQRYEEAAADVASAAAEFRTRLPGPVVPDGGDSRSGAARIQATSQGTPLTARLLDDHIQRPPEAQSAGPDHQSRHNAEAIKDLYFVGRMTALDLNVTQWGLGGRSAALLGALPESG